MFFHPADKFYSITLYSFLMLGMVNPGDEVLITTGTVQTRSIRENAYRYIDVDAMTPLTYPQGFVPATGGDELVTLTDYSPVQAKEAIVEMDLGVVNLPVPDLSEGA